jgi:hypothetical protein
VVITVAIFLVPTAAICYTNTAIDALSARFQYSMPAKNDDTSNDTNRARESDGERGDEDCQTEIQETAPFVPITRAVSSEKFPQQLEKRKIANRICTLDFDFIGTSSWFTRQDRISTHH